MNREQRRRAEKALRCARKGKTVNSKLGVKVQVNYEVRDKHGNLVNRAVKREAPHDPE